MCLSITAFASAVTLWTFCVSLILLSKSSHRFSSPSPSPPAEVDGCGDSGGGSCFDVSRIINALHSEIQSFTAASALTALPKTTVLNLGSKRVALANTLKNSTAPKHCFRFVIRLFVR